MYLKSKVIKALEASIGTSILNLSKMDADEELKFVESRIGKTPVFLKRADSRMQGRGNPLLVRRRICTMEDIDKKIMEM